VQTRVIRIEDGPIELSHDDWEAIEVAPGDVGELIVSGDHVCGGYYRNPDADRQNKIVEPDGTVWHRMGDTGYSDGEGQFWLVGRVHSTIRRRDNLVHPQLVEQAAAASDPRVRRLAAVGLPDDELGERVALVVEARGAGSDLRREVEARLEAAGMNVDQILVTDRDLPLDPRHRSKVDYGQLRHLIERGVISGGAR
jgi:acyl-CoA synthetase (AMP-forming)/AMP-acid ligase II